MALFAASVGLGDSAGSNNNQSYSVIIPLHIYCQSAVKRARSHLPTVPPVNLCLHEERASRQRTCYSAVICLKAYY